MRAKEFIKELFEPQFKNTKKKVAHNLKALRREADKPGTNSGAFGYVRDTPNDPGTVTKTAYDLEPGNRMSDYANDNTVVDAYYIWVKVCGEQGKMAQNPYLPRVYSVDDREDVNGMRMPRYQIEKLYTYEHEFVSSDMLLSIANKLGGEQDNVAELVSYYGRWNEEELKSKLWKEIVRKVKSVEFEDKLALRAWKLASDIVNKWSSDFDSSIWKDMHIGNFMIRITNVGPQLVFTDPIAGAVPYQDIVKFFQQEMLSESASSNVLLEYNRAKTEQQFGPKLLQRTQSGPDKKSFDTIGARVQQKLSNENPEIQPNQLSSMVSGFLLNDLLSQLEMSDPTRNQAYVPWIAREYAAGNIQRLEDLHTRVKPSLAKFEMYKRKKDFPAEAKDIMRINFQTLEDVVTKYQPAENIVDRGQATTVFDDATVRVINPINEKAACYYGQGTKWCTAARDNNMFDHYARDGSLYILLPKQPEYEGEKYQLHFESSQFMDEGDNPVAINNLLLKRFPTLNEFFMEKHPDLKNAIVFIEDDILEGVGKLISEIALQQAYELVNDMEVEDDYFHQWQAEEAIEKGFVDEEGDIDWNLVSGDDSLNDYLSHNNEARRLIEDVKSIAELSGSSIRIWANEVQEEDYSGSDELLQMRQMDEVYAKIFKDELDDSGELIAKFITRRVYIDSTGRYSGAGIVQGTYKNYTVGTTKQ